MTSDKQDQRAGGAQDQRADRKRVQPNGDHRLSPVRLNILGTPCDGADSCPARRCIARRRRREIRGRHPHAIQRRVDFARRARTHRGPWPASPNYTKSEAKAHQRQKAGKTGGQTRRRARLPLDEPALQPSFRRERRALNGGIWPVAGCDEAGRGPLAGPVVAAAVILDPQRIPRGLERLQEARRAGAREALREDLRNGAGVGRLRLDRAHRPRQYPARLAVGARRARSRRCRSAQARLRRRQQPHRLRLRMHGGGLGRRAGFLDRGRLHRRQGHPRPADGPAGTTRIPATASSAIWATACRSISRRLPGSGPSIHHRKSFAPVAAKLAALGGASDEAIADLLPL